MSGVACEDNCLKSVQWNAHAVCRSSVLLHCSTSSCQHSLLELYHAAAAMAISNTPYKLVGHQGPLGNVTWPPAIQSHLQACLFSNKHLYGCTVYGC